MIKQESRAYFRALGAHVTRLRNEHGMTQAELARSLGVSQQTVFAYELGDRRISVLILVKLAKIFEVTRSAGRNGCHCGSPEAPPLSGRNATCRPVPAAQ